MQPFKIIVLLILISLVAVFTFQNTQAVEVTLYFWSFSLSVSLLLLATFTIGVLCGMLLTVVHSIIKKRRTEKSVPETLTYHGKDS
jgi:uncharacterized integral membrane protein